MKNPRWANKRNQKIQGQISLQLEVIFKFSQKKSIFSRSNPTFSRKNDLLSTKTLDDLFLYFSEETSGEKNFPLMFQKIPEKPKDF